MAIREIVRLDNPVLRRKANKVTVFDARLQQLVDDMVETMMDAPGVGLAAPQVGVSQRLIVVRLPDDEESREEYGDQAGVLYVVANPEIVKASRSKVEGVEACLSIPGFYGKVDRHDQVLIKGLDRHGKPTRIRAKDWLARVFQHEIDHLDGRLYIDIASDVWEAKKDDEDEGAAGENQAADTSTQAS
jgi:peptide deformylase